MTLRILSLCGMLSPVIYVFMTILGGALRPGYSHISDTVSELFSPGSPNKRLLDSLSTSTAVLNILFGVGVLRFVRGSEHSEMVGWIGAGLIIVGGVVNIATATVFPQDAWGSPSTFPGQMHKILVGILALLSILSTLLLGIWLNGADIFPGFGTYSFVTVAIIILSGGFAAMKLGSPIMGLTERITVVVVLQWTFILGLRIFSIAV
ncbi:MAG: DUF998 domain-containing protein [Anaerolineales bacterium]|nr:DUF998 domain-containing protein [Anaerolineales bacterium]